MTGAMVEAAATPGETLEMRLGILGDGQTAVTGPTIIAQRLIASDRNNRRLVRLFDQFGRHFGRRRGQAHRRLYQPGRQSLCDGSAVLLRQRAVVGGSGTEHVRSAGFRPSWPLGLRLAETKVIFRAMIHNLVRFREGEVSAEPLEIPRIPAFPSARRELRPPKISQGDDKAAGIAA